MALAPRADRPIDPLTRLIIRKVKDAAAGLGLEVFLVGATARIILIEHVFGLHTGRATRDIDFAFAVERWEQFQAIKDRLTSTSTFEEAGRVAQRLFYKPDSGDFKYVVDLIPFGGLAGDKNMIAWPPDMSVLMNVAGYRDAHASAALVEVEPGLEIAVASLPGMAILKLFAWNDRGQEDPKDAIDLVTMLRQYNEAGNQQRIYEEGMPALEAAGFEIELAGAWLLGRDASSLTSPGTRNELGAMFEQTPLMERLVEDMAKALRPREDALGYSSTLLEQFRKGFNEQTSMAE